MAGLPCPTNSRGALWWSSRDHQLQNSTQTPTSLVSSIIFAPRFPPRSSNPLWQLLLGLRRVKLHYLGALGLHCSFVEGRRLDGGLPVCLPELALHLTCLPCPHCYIEEGGSGILKTRRLRRSSDNHVAESKPELRPPDSSSCCFFFAAFYDLFHFYFLSYLKRF